MNENCWISWMRFKVSGCRNQVAGLKRKEVRARMGKSITVRALIK